MIHRAAGGVGHFAVPPAKHLGAYVISTGSPASKEFIIDVGADEFIDYSMESIGRIVVDADVVLDPLPGPHFVESLNAVIFGGRVIRLLPYDECDDRMAAIVDQKKLFTRKIIVSFNGKI